MNNYFSLFSDCLLVRGSNGNAIYDTTNNRLIFLEDIIADVLQKNRGKSIPELKALYEHKYDSGIDAYFNNFSESKIGFFTNDINPFIPISPNFSTPYGIENFVLEVSDKYDFRKVIDNVSKLSCYAIQIRLYDIPDRKHFTDILNIINSYPYRFVDILINGKGLNEDWIKSILLNIHLLDRMIIYNSAARASHDKCFFLDRPFYAGKIAGMGKDQVFISKKYFFESHQFNPTVYKKLSIDVNGEIKNDISHGLSYGNVSDNDIIEIYQSKSFRKSWTINRDKIKGCRSCVFRYCCTFSGEVSHAEESNDHVLTDACGVNPNQSKQT